MFLSPEGHILEICQIFSAFTDLKNAIVIYYMEFILFIFNNISSLVYVLMNENNLQNYYSHLELFFMVVWLF